MNMKRAVAASAANFKDRHVVVWLTPGDVQWPHRCACCMRRPEKTATAWDNDRVVAQYPICRPCYQHARVDDRAMLTAMGIAAAGIVGGWVALFGLAVMAYVVLQLILMFLAFLALTGAVYWVINTLFGRKGQSCPDAGWPVETLVNANLNAVLGKDSERNDEKQLRLWCEQQEAGLGPGAYAIQLRNISYAAELISTNGGDPTRLHYVQEAY